MGKSKKSLKGYELNNLLFFLAMIIVLGGVCWIFYGLVTKNPDAVKDVDPVITSETTTGDIAVFELDGFNIVGMSRTYRSRLEIPVTDDGLIKGMYDLPGVEEIVLEQRRVIVKKNGTIEWNKLSGPITDILKEHLHSHY